MPLTRLGAREIVLLGVLPLALAAVLAAKGHPYFALAVLPIPLFVFNFFRDPERRIPQEGALLVSPADGKVAAVLQVDEPHYLKGRGHCIGIFLNVFNVHVNRSPGAGVVEYVKYTPGRFLDARDPRVSAENEANAVGIRLDDGRRVLVRQVAGLIARRILCTVKPGDRVERGQRIGMIKFGSYTELIVEASAGWIPALTIGQTVKGGCMVAFKAEAGIPAGAA